MRSAVEHMDSAWRFSNARFSRRDPDVVVTKEARGQDNKTTRMPTKL
jgi:hypothetical protein